MSYKDEWKEYVLSEVIDTFLDYRGKTPKKTKSGIPLITAKVVKKGRILEPNEFIALDNYVPWMRRGLPKYGDVVLTVEAPLGEVGQILTHDKIALAQRIITLRGKENILNNTFLKYSLQSNKMQGRLEARATGTTVIGIKSSELKKVEIPLPSLPVQTRIASILSAFDEKIEVNRQMNATLEAMAQAMFREMCLPDDEKNLEDGWSSTILENHVEVGRGLSYKGAGLTNAEDEDGLPMHNLNSVFEGGGYKFKGIKFYNGKYRERHLICTY